MVEVFAINLNRDLKYNEFENLLKLVSQEKKDRILRFRRYKDSETCLLTDAMVRKLIMEKCNIKNEQITFKKGVNGKPELSKPHININFNCSHSENFIVCAMSKMHVGIDIEKIKNIDMAIAKRFFSKSEYDDLSKLEMNKQVKYFYDLWTLKESYIKWDGRGLSIPLQDFSFSIKEDKAITFESKVYNNDCYFKQYFIDDEYKLSICSSESEYCNMVVVLKINKLIESLCKLC